MSRYSDEAVTETVEKQIVCSCSTSAAAQKMAQKRNRVLSIQSHVVRGYVGNKSAVFPLQLLGFEVDYINSVQFSNHTGYRYWKGQILCDEELATLMDGLHHNGLDHYSHLLTGYVGNPDFLKRIAEVVKQLRNVNPNLLYVCDPVMGDNGEMYVPQELLEIYKDTIVPLADIITPNQYEVELLTGKKIQTVEDAWTATEHFHKLGCSTVVLSSTELGDDDYLLGLASSTIGNKHIALTVKIPRVKASFTGTGDLFASLLLAWMACTDGDLKISLEKTCSTLQLVLKRTLEYANSVKGNADKPSVGQMELQLIQSKADIENPPDIIKATIVKMR